MGKEGSSSVGQDLVAKAVPESRSLEEGGHRSKGIVGRENGICKCFSATINPCFCKGLSGVLVHGAGGPC